MGAVEIREEERGGELKKVLELFHTQGRGEGTPVNC